ncbi:hypothetical protein C2S51_019388 [Perilla frutescens var. frutescens]|nr:hypothetical protein C2S51_019388 [Perilla frutescens var. frutescens]
MKLFSRLSSHQNPASRILSSSINLVLRHHGLADENSRYRYLCNYSRLMQTYNTQTRKFSVNSSGVQPSTPLPPRPPSSYLNWIIGVVLSIIVPSTSSTWGPLLQFKKDVDTAVETVEDIAEVVEKVAEIVDRVAEDISDDLPEGGKLKKVVDIVGVVAEATAEDARTVGDVIDKFQEVEEKLVGKP